MAKKLSEYKNEEATAILADIIGPAAEIFSDDDIKKAFTGGSKKEAVKLALKKHGKELIDILAIYDGIPRDQYTVNPAQILGKSLAIINDPDLMSAFTLPEQTAEN